MALADIPITIPIIAKTKAFLAVAIFSGFPAEIRYKIAETIIIIVPKEAISIPTPSAIFSNKSSNVFVLPRGLGIVTAPDASEKSIKEKIAKLNKARNKNFLVI